MSTASETFPELVHRLNEVSVKKRHEAFRDVAWDEPEMQVDPRDRRWQLPRSNALGATSWYRALPEEARTRLGLEWTCQTLRYGVSFECCLSRGLLEFVNAQPSGSPLIRYAMHELIEESHHSLMFMELIRRTGCETEDVSVVERWLQGHVARWGRTFPELFFFCVLSGEVFIDHDNRERLRAREPMHPLLRRVVQIHVTEEARHVKFAESFLRDRLPTLPAWKKRVLCIFVPAAMKRGVAMMLRPQPHIVKRHAIPARVMREAFGPGTAHDRAVKEVVSPVLALLDYASR
jgi:hypothetical protein